MEQFTPSVLPAYLNLLSHSLCVSKYWLYYGFVMLNIYVFPSYYLFIDSNDLSLGWCFLPWCKLYECIYSLSWVVIFSPSLYVFSLLLSM